MSTPSSGGTFPFLALPPEIRNRIYGSCSPQSMCFIIGDGRCMRAPDEEGDIQTIAGIEHATTTWSEQNPGSVGPATSAHTDFRSSLSQLLRTCRQIHNEAKALLYNNYFQIQFGEELQMFPPESRKEIRHMVIFLEWDNLHFCLPRQDGRYIETWAGLLRGLSTLQLIVGPNPRHLVYPNGWPELLKKHLEFIDQHIPPHVKVVVDTDGEESTSQLVDETVSNHCTFEQIAAGDEVFERGKFQIYYDYDFDLDLDLDERSSEDDEFIDEDDPYYSLWN